MSKTILMDEIHLRVVAPRGLATNEYDAIVGTLNGRPFQIGLRRASAR